MHKRSYRKVLFISILIVILISTLLLPNAFGNPGESKLDQIRHQKKETEIYRDHKGRVRFMSGKFTKPSKRPAKEIVADFIDGNDDAIKNSKAVRNGKKMVHYATKAQHDNIYGKTILELYQTYDGIPVHGTTKYVHVDQEGVVTLASGYFVTELENCPSLAASVTLSKQRAIDIVARDLGIMSSSIEKSSVDLYVYPLEKENDAVYAYCVKISYNLPEPGDWTYYIDAAKGTLISKFSNIRTISGTGYGYTTFYNYVSFPINRFGNWPNYIAYLTYNNAGFFTANYNNSYYDYSEIYEYSNSDGLIYFWDRSAVDAHYYASKTYDYFYENFGRTGSPTHVGVHLGWNYKNAGYRPSTGAIIFGDGDGVDYRSFTADPDIVAHEYTHSIVYQETGLEYQFESGAIDESLADTFAALVQDYIQPGQNCWALGTETTISGTGIRSMSDPPSILQSNGRYQPDHYSNYYCTTSDYGGVHTNSGILNKAAYLISEGGTFNDYTVYGLGKGVTAQIYYRAITNYSITSTSDFNDFYYALKNAAWEVYGYDGYYAVTEAFAAVGIGSHYKIVSNYNNLAVESIGNDIILNPDVPQSSQRWQLIYLPDDGSYLLRCKANKKCIDVPYGGTYVQGYTQNNTNEQRWYLMYQWDEYNQIYHYLWRNKSSDQYMTVYNWGTTNGTPVIQYNFHDGIDQKWRLEYVDADCEQYIP